MDYAHLGRTGLRVSRLAFGTMHLGELTDGTAGFAIMDEALDAGVNLFDTADVHGGAQSAGSARRLCLAASPGARQDDPPLIVRTT